MSGDSENKGLASRINLKGINSGTVSLYLSPDRIPTIDSRAVRLGDFDVKGEEVFFGTVTPKLSAGPQFLKADHGGVVTVGAFTSGYSSSSYVFVQMKPSVDGYSITLVDPVTAIQGAQGKGNYFEALVLAVTYFEQLGKRRLAENFRGEIRPERFKRLQSVDEIITLLFASKLIQKETYDKMIEVNEKRNQMIHRDIGEPFLIVEAEAKSLISKAVECTKDLIS